MCEHGEGSPIPALRWKLLCMNLSGETPLFLKPQPAAKPPANGKGPKKSKRPSGKKSTP
jgi:hypothetical protein